MATLQIRRKPEIISFPYVTDSCQIQQFMIGHPDCADLETGTLTVDKASMLAIMKHKRSQWRLGASLMDLKQDSGYLNHCR
jgi:hypothetical protein